MRPWGIKRLFSFPSRTRAEVRADIDDELSFHLDMCVDALRKAGLSDQAARTQALREMGRTDTVLSRWKRSGSGRDGNAVSAGCWTTCGGI